MKKAETLHRLCADRACICGHLKQCGDDPKNQLCAERACIRCLRYVYRKAMPVPAFAGHLCREMV